MNLLDITQREPRPLPWAEGEKIPWNEAGFSKRMLHEHLAQTHDAASRRAIIIDQQVAWIHSTVLEGRIGRVLDLGCGPGLYTQRLAQRGHECEGIDFSPASIDYARQHSSGRCTYLLEDIRQADYGGGWDLVMLIFGEFNVFTPADAGQILRKAQEALKPDAALLLEVHNEEFVRRLGHEASTWYSRDSGLFSEQSHIVLHEHFWHEDARVASQRYYVIDAGTAAVSRYASSMQAYSDAQYEALLADCGFPLRTFYRSLAGHEHEQEGLQVIVARKNPA